MNRIATDFPLEELLTASEFPLHSVSLHGGWNDGSLMQPLMEPKRGTCSNFLMLKWVGIILVGALILGGLVLAGVLELAAGMVKIIFFLVVALVLALVIGGWMTKRNLSNRR